MLKWFAYTNFFGHYTFLRRIQCNIFGHEWFCWLVNDTKLEGWCGWCVRKTSMYPKMKARI
jgi:hypothetical protein